MYTTKAFENNDILRITGLDQKTVSQWLARGIVHSAKPSPGSGNRHLYYFPDVIRFAVLAKLSHAGIQVSKAREIADFVVFRMSECATFEKDAVIVVGTGIDGDYSYRTETTWVGNTSSAVSLIIPIGRIITETLKELSN